MATTVTDLEERHTNYVEKVDGQLLDIHRKVNVLEAQFPLLVNSIDKLAANLTGSIQQLAGVVAAMQSQLNAVLATVQATQTQLAVVVQKTDVFAARTDQVEKKLDTLSLSYSAFEARGDVTNKFLKWVGGLVAVAIIAIIGSAITVARSAGNLESDVRHLQESMNEVKRDIADIKAKLK